LEIAMQGVYNFIQVRPDLATSGVIAAESFAEVRAAGYDVVINLLPDDSKYAVAEEAAIVADLAMDYVYIPVDFSAPVASNYEDFATAMRAAEGKKVWVHCAANWRVSSFVSLYGERDLGWSQSTSEALVEKAWGEPDEVWKQFIAEIRMAEQFD
jgi:protein tyrosine phosphatase (PTP) superfamily phosphohydrolase (DUF442 family)